MPEPILADAAGSSHEQYDISRADLVRFAEQCRRQLRRPISDRIRFGFFRNPDPVRNQNVNRSFASMEEYRRFCEARYPAHYGYSRSAGE